MNRPDTWPPHWPSDDELLGRAVVHAVNSVRPDKRWVPVRQLFSVGSTVANALVERYVDENGDMKR